MQSTSTKSRSSFQQRKVTSELVNEAEKNKKDPLRYLLIVLTSAERCWSHAMALKQEANTEHRKKFHLLRKLEKAVIYARILHGLCTAELSICDARTKLESEAYLYYMRGMFLFELQNWKSCANYLRKAQAIYTKLGQAISDQDIALLYRQRVDEMQPTLRYCAFSLGEEHSGKIELLAGSASDGADDFLVSKLDQLILQTQEKQAVTLQEVTWLGTKISVQDEKIRTFLLLMQDKSGLNLNQLERLLFECRECIQSVRDAKDKGKLYCYLQYLRHELTCQRNQDLIDSLQNPAEMIRPYEVIVASIEDLKALPLQQHFDNLNEVNLLFEKLDAEITAFKAFRCYCIAKSGKIGWKETITLLHRSTLYAREAIDHHLTNDALQNRLQDLIRKSEADKFATYANGLMDEAAPEQNAAAQVTTHSYF
jgi:signal recognition particle subunit SRP68